MRFEPWLTRQARLHPERLALECRGEWLTYARLHERASGAAASLAEAGAGPGDRVVVALPPGVPFVVAFHACLLRKAVAVPVDPRLAPAEREARAQGAALVVDEPLGEAGAPPSAETWGDADVLMVVHTSGTTAAPKPVAITYGNVRASAAGHALALGLDPAERWLCPMPLSHVGGLMVLLRSVVYGTAVLLAPPNPGGFDAAAIARRLNRGDATVASLVPTMLRRALDAGLERPRRLRCLLLGGGSADLALLERAVRCGVPVVQTYGLTEATSQVTVSDPGDPFTAGTPLPGVDVRLAADGEILVEGPVVASGGVLRTGDLGRLDERGRLTVVGRKSDTIVTGGENVAPAEVEAVLQAHPAVAEAAVFGRPDPEWGEAVVARVVLRAGHELDPVDLGDWCRAQLARFKVPKAFERANDLPRTEAGKLLRRSLT